MHEPVRSAVIGLVSGMIGAFLVVTMTGTPESASISPVTKSETDLRVFEERLAAMESRLATESIDVLATIEQTNTKEMPDELPPMTADTLVDSQSPNPEDQFFNMMKSQTSQTNAKLRETGWTEADIDVLEQLRNRAHLEMDEHIFHQTRVMLNQYPELMLGTNAIREGLTEERYEEYLRASGNKRLAVPVRSVLDGSVGEMAGLQAGDLIRRYGSERVYNDQDLTLAMASGEIGEPVTVEVERNGAIFYFTVSRGPLGTTRISSMLIK